jgi:hypothetical protein
MSYSWRSILKGVKLLKEGVIKRVGDGSTISIWSDPWVPREGSPFLVTRRGNVMLDWAADLIDPVTGQWDDELLNDCLWPADAAHVSNIPICILEEDTWAWRMEPKGTFSVKSAYKLHKALEERNGNASGVNYSDKEVGFAWKEI